MRTFIAIPLPDNIHSILRSLQGSLKLSGAKISLAKDFHLTLKFLGEVDERQVEKITEALHRVKFKPFTLNLSKIGVFPNENYLRVVWVGVSPPEQVIQLGSQVEKALQQFHFKKDHDLHPHLTLARIAYIPQDEKQHFVQSLKSIPIPQESFHVDHFTLFKSTLTPSGPVYEVLRAFG